MRPTLLVLHGPPAVGKYTVGRLVAEGLGWPLFHNHLAVDLALELFPFGTPGFVALRERIWLDGFALSVEAGQSLVFTFSPESTVPRDFPERMVALVEGLGGRVCAVRLTCAEAALEERIGGESRREFGKLVDPALYRTLRDDGVFEAIWMPEPLVVLDTGVLGPEEAAGRVVSAVGAVD